MNAVTPSVESSVTIGRWRNLWIIDAGTYDRQPAIRDVMDRHDRLVAEELPAQFGQTLLRSQVDASPEVWRIRELSLGFTVDVGWPASSDVARAWSDRVASRVMEIVSSRVESEDILRFADRAAFLARFLLDLAAGRAWGKWYYDEFRSLDQLSTGRAIAEALTREPADGVCTVLHLARSGALERVLHVLTDNDARAIYEGLFDAARTAHQPLGSLPMAGSDERKSASRLQSFSELSMWAGRLLDVWSTEPMRADSGPRKDYHDALRWMFRAALRFPGAEQEPAAIAALDGLLELRRVLGSMGSSLAADRLVRHLVDGKASLDEAIDAARSGGSAFPETGLRFVEQIARGDPDWAAQAASELLRDSRRPGAAAVFDGESMITPFGGVYLIAPTLVELGLQEIANAAAGNIDQALDGASVLRHYIFAQSLGSARGMEALSDLGVRFLSGCHRSLVLVNQRFDPQLVAFAQAMFVRNLIALTGADGKCLVAEVIRPTGHDGEVILLRDPIQHLWLYASAWPREIAAQQRVLIGGIDLVRETTGTQPHLVLLGASAPLSASRPLRERTSSVIPLIAPGDNDELAATSSQIESIFKSTSRELLASRLSSSDMEFNYFWMKDGDAESVALNLLTTLMSRAALKGFARRLMGFQSASPEHLYRNFLDGISTVRVRARQVDVELPQCPLSLVLHLSGIDRQSYAVPWLEGREICLLPPRE